MFPFRLMLSLYLKKPYVYKSYGLFRASHFHNPTEISNPRQSAASRFLLSCQMPMHPCKQACSLHSRLMLSLYLKKPYVYKSYGLFRASHFHNPTEISNPRQSAASRFLLSCQMPMHPCKQACSLHSRLTGTYTLKKEVTRPEALLVPL